MMLMTMYYHDCLRDRCRLFECPNLMLTYYVLLALIVEEYYRFNEDLHSLYSQRVVLTSSYSEEQ